MHRAGRRRERRLVPDARASRRTATRSRRSRASPAATGCIRSSRRSSTRARPSAGSASRASSSRRRRCSRTTRTRRRAEIEEGLAGNLCRCAGYEQIIEAVAAAADGAGSVRQVVTRTDGSRIGSRRRLRVGGARPRHRPAGVRRRPPPRGRPPRQARDARRRPRPDRRDRHAAPRSRVPGVRLVLTAGRPARSRCRGSGRSARTGRCSRSARRTTTASRSRRSRPRRPDAAEEAARPRARRVRGAAGRLHDRRRARPGRAARPGPGAPPGRPAARRTNVLREHHYGWGDVDAADRPTSSSRARTRSRWSPSSRSSRTPSWPPPTATGSPSGARSSTRTGCSGSSPACSACRCPRSGSSRPIRAAAFGGKQHAKYEPLVAFMALRTGRPVRLVLTLEETFQAVRRGASEIRVRTGFRTRRHAGRSATSRPTTSIGAYADIADRTVAKGSYTSGGPYRMPAVRIVARSVLSHTTPSTAFRGFGNPQQIWAVESNMDEAARGARHRPARAPAAQPGQPRRGVHPRRHAGRRRLGPDRRAGRPR